MKNLLGFTLILLLPLGASAFDGTSFSGNPAGTGTGGGINGCVGKPCLFIDTSNDPLTGDLVTGTLVDPHDNTIHGGFPNGSGRENDPAFNVEGFIDINGAFSDPAAVKPMLELTSNQVFTDNAYSFVRMTGSLSGSNNPFMELLHTATFTMPTATDTENVTYKASIDLQANGVDSGVAQVHSVSGFEVQVVSPFATGLCFPGGTDLCYHYGMSTPSAEIAGTGYILKDTFHNVSQNNIGIVDHLFRFGTREGQVFDAGDHLVDFSTGNVDVAYITADGGGHFTDTTITGKLTVTGVIDPTALVLSGGTNLYIESADGSTAAAAGIGSNKGRLRYLNGTGWQASANDGVWSTLATGSGSAFVQNGNSFGTLATLGTDDAFGLSLETGGLSRLNVLSTGEIIAGGPTVTAFTASSTIFSVVQPTAGSPALFGARAAGAPAVFFGASSGGTVTAPTASTPGAPLFILASTGYGSDNLVEPDGAAYVGFFMDGAPAASSIGGSITLFTKTAADAAPIARLYVMGSGFVGVNVNAPVASEIFGVSGDAYVSGKLTVAGVIDPTALILSGSTDLYLESADGSTAAAAGIGSNKGRIRYLNGTGWQLSANDGAWSTVATTGSIPVNAFVQNGNTFGALATLGTNDNFALALETNGTTNATLATTGQLTLQPGVVRTSGSPYVLRVNNVADTGLTAGVGSPDVLFDLSADRTFATGAITNQRALWVMDPTYSFAAASTITNAATVSINGPPSAGTNATITNAYSLWVESGNSKFAGDVFAENGVFGLDVAVNGGDLTSALGTFNLLTAQDALHIADAVPEVGPQEVFVGTSGSDEGNLYIFGNGSVGCNVLAVGPTGAFPQEASLTCAGNVLAKRQLNLTTSALTGLSAGTEYTDSFLNIAATRTFATGAIATQRAVRVAAPTYAFAGASTITNAATFAIAGAPIAGANATITNPYALWVQSGASLLDGAVHITGKLTVDGAIDPPSLSLSGGTALFVDSADGSTAPVSAPNHGRLRYIDNGATGTWQTSAEGGLYKALVTTSGAALTASRAVFTDAASDLVTAGASAALLASLTDETGTGVAVFGTSPTITTSLVAGSASFDLLNTTATTINAFGAATTVNMGNTAGTNTVSGTTVLTKGASAGELRFLEPSGSGTNYTSFTAVAQAADAAYTLPPALPTVNGQVLSGTTGGVLSWATPAAGTITAVGSMTSGAVFASAAASGQWHGLGAGAGRISYTDAATDQVNVESAILSVGSTSPRSGAIVYGFGGFLVSEVDDYASIRAYAHGVGVAATNAMFSSRGTTASPTATQSGDLVGAVQMGGYDGASYLGRANIYTYASQNWSIGNHGESMQFTTTATGTTDDVIRVVIDQNGNVGVGTDLTPDTLLDVQGTLSAGTNGEMSVSTNGDTTVQDLAVNGGDVTSTTGSINFLGGSSSTGCTMTDSNGNLACSGNLLLNLNGAQQILLGATTGSTDTENIKLEMTQIYTSGTAVGAYGAYFDLTNNGATPVLMAANVGHATFTSGSGDTIGIFGLAVKTNNANNAGTMIAGRFEARHNGGTASTVTTLNSLFAETQQTGNSTTVTNMWGASIGNEDSTGTNTRTRQAGAIIYDASDASGSDATILYLTTSSYSSIPGEFPSGDWALYSKSARNSHLTGDLEIEGGDLTAVTTTTFNLINTVATTINFGAAASTSLNIGYSGGLLNSAAAIAPYRTVVNGPAAPFACDSTHEGYFYYVRDSTTGGNVGGYCVCQGTEGAPDTFAWVAGVPAPTACP